MASKKILARTIAALLLICGAITGAESASVEGSLAEINKLPPAQRQARLEEGARQEGAFVYYSISSADLIAAYIKGFATR